MGEKILPLQEILLVYMLEMGHLHFSPCRRTLICLLLLALLSRRSVKVAVGLFQMAPGTEGMTQCSVAQAVGGGQNSLLHQCSFYLGKRNCEEDVMGEIV